MSSIFINLETKTELKKTATSNEEQSTTESVIGKKIINFPILPGHSPSGINAATVVAVEIIIGKAISEIGVVPDIRVEQKGEEFSINTVNWKLENSLFVLEKTEKK